MGIYEIRTVKSAAADFSRADTACVTIFPWDGCYQPVTAAQAVALKDAFAVRMCTDETNPRTEIKDLNGPVHTDSCMEFFFMPDPKNSKKYINWEFNSAGVLFISIGTDRYDRNILEIKNYTDLFQVKTRVGKDGWEIGYRIPYEFLSSYFPCFQIREGRVMKGNFYKCADKAKQPHYGCWSPIDLPEPDFHCPDFFGELILV